jgi:predicted transcriptional regulator
MDIELGTRKRIYELIRDSPGIHLREIERRLGLSMGNLQYHIHYLENHNLIFQLKDEEYVRYFIKKKKTNEYERNILCFLRRTGSRHILINLLKDTEMNSKEISEIIGLSPSTISWHLNKLVKVGILEKEKENRKSNFTIKDPELVAELLISYKESFLDSILDSFIEMWEFGRNKK